MIRAHGQFTDLYRESERVKTFTHWPVPHIRPAPLARCGFYYIGYRDIVRCYFCSVELGDWREHDVVECEHRRWSQYCPLLVGRRTDNIPIDPNFDPQETSFVPDVHGSDPPTSRSSLPGGSSSNRPAGVPNVPTTNIKPSYPKYATEAARLASFQYWPKSIKQTPAQMADAGFFYTEKNDTVACFSCGGSLNGWYPEDEPWVEHATNFSGCHYLNLMKDHAFVEQCQAMRAQSSASMTEVHYSKTSEQKQESKDSDVADEKLCKICYANPYNTTFIPCGHVVACAKCASSVGRCPVCNEAFSNVVRIYLS